MNGGVASRWFVDSHPSNNHINLENPHLKIYTGIYTILNIEVGKHNKNLIKIIDKNGLEGVFNSALQLDDKEYEDKTKSYPIHSPPIIGDKNSKCTKQ